MGGRLKGTGGQTRALQQSPCFQPGESVIQVVGRGDLRTGRSKRRMGIALNGRQAAVGRLQLKRVALAGVDRENVRGPRPNPKTFEDRTFDGCSIAAVRWVKNIRARRAPNFYMLEYRPLNFLFRPEASHISRQPRHETMPSPYELQRSPASAGYRE
jgi:hypothetical protein